MRSLLRVLSLLLAFVLVTSACSEDDPITESASDLADDTAAEADDTADDMADDAADDMADDAADDMADDAADDMADDADAADETTEDPGTIVDVAVGAGSFETLVAAVIEAGLVDTLSGEGPFTVFAPTDEAFAAALDALGLTAEELLASPDLADILTYHVIAGEVDAATAISLDGQSAATVNGAEITISVVDGSVVINDTATVIAADVTANNGIIHVIDAVLLPPA